MRRMLLIFSHRLTRDQEREARECLGCSELVPLPPNLQEKWSNVDPLQEDITDWMKEINAWISVNSSAGDYLLVEGDFGMTFAVVNWALENDRISVYSTTGRDYSSNEESDGTLTNIHRFRHVRFRQYKKPV